jgi:hypothetical protein
MMKQKRRYSLTMDDEFYKHLEGRAALNNRSLNKEILFLVEGALASELDGNLHILRVLMKAQGGLPPTPQSEPEE